MSVAKVHPDGLLLSKIARLVMKSGKLSVAERIVDHAVGVIKQAQMDPTDTVSKAVMNASPVIETRSVKKGGSNYQVPFPIPPQRQSSMGMKLIIATARKRKERGMGERLAAELILASQNDGAAVKKRDEMHKIAQANRAYAAYRW
jgi:small subunit ribosomal protein S7